MKCVIHEKKTAARRLQQLKMEDIVLNTAEAEARKTTCAEPTLNQSLRQRLLEIERNKDAKRCSKNIRLLQDAERQRAAHLLAKYSTLKTRDIKWRHKSNFGSLLYKADQQQGIHMKVNQMIYMRPKEGDLSPCPRDPRTRVSASSDLVSNCRSTRLGRWRSWPSPPL